MNSSLFHHFRVRSFALCFLVCTTPVSLGQILEYRFNSEGITSANSGQNTAEATLYNTEKAPADLHSQPGTGVSGQTEDRAFDNTSSIGFGGKEGGGGRAEVMTDALNDLSSFTITGWYAIPDSDTFQGARLFEKMDSPQSLLSLYLGRGNTEGTLTLVLGTPTHDHSHVISGGSTLLGMRNAWIFFAVTYDGTRDSDNVRFYVGSITEPVEQIGTPETLPAGALGYFTKALAIGNNIHANRPTRAYLDNFRIFGSTDDASGVLDSEHLERLREADASNSEL